MREFTGRHMWIIMASAFAVIITVNLVMAVFAIHTFPGTIVRNSYVASQDFNKHLSLARERVALEIQAGLTITGQTIRLEVYDKSGNGVRGLEVFGRAGRAASALTDQDLSFTEVAPAIYEADFQFPGAGKWKLNLHGRDAQERLVVAIAQDYWAPPE